MDRNRNQDLCLALMRADSEQTAIRLLEEAGYWNNPAVWRFYGDRETNFNTIGNQQSRPDAALVEKLINSVDARLMNECLAGGVGPEGPDAPQSVREAVAQLFEGRSSPAGATAGRISDWPEKVRREVARGITLASTGCMPSQGNPSFTIADSGEGQTPERMTCTLLSLDRSNKLRVPFVQGKFNMGGTGVLQFCGQHNLQLVVSRRNPAIVAKWGTEDETDLQWGFSIVRREEPRAGRRTSAYTYLAARGVRVLFEQFADERLEGIELAGARTADRRRHRSHEILFHGAGGQAELAGDAAHRPMLAAGETMNSVDLFKAQHGCGYRPARGAAPEGCCWQDAEGVGTGQAGD